jgi:hypothetical protein
VVVNIPDMAGVMAGAFEVLAFFSLSASLCTFNRSSCFLSSLRV